MVGFGTLIVYAHEDGLLVIGMHELSPYRYMTAKSKAARVSTIDTKTFSRRDANASSALFDSDEKSSEKSKISPAILELIHSHWGLASETTSRMNR
eukprot:scaffold259081_cov42-Attheya_sp.AAC.1